MHKTDMEHTVCFVFLLVLQHVYSLPTGNPEEQPDDVYMVDQVPTDPTTNGSLPEAASGGRPGQATNTHSCERVRAVPSHLRSSTHMWPYGLTNFYQKYTEAYGIPVVGSSRLSDSALRRACYVVRFLFADRPGLRRSYYRMYGRFALMATTEVTTNIPEHTSLGSWWNSRARGLGATRDRPVSTGGEENALCLANDRYSVEDIVLHEYSHGLHLLGARYQISGFDSRLKTLYNNAKSRGLWRNTYALNTDHEYWAEGVQSYFNANAYSNPPNGIHNHVNTREKLASYDPGLYQLIKEVFPCGNTYISRCEYDREREQNQVLKMDCDENGNEKGSTSSTTTTSPQTSAPCQDLEAHCPSWAAGGWCERSPEYMRRSCGRSCGTCDESLTTSTTTTQTPSNCKDYNHYCKDWADSGECQKNAAYMLVYCKKSCQQTC